MLRASRCLEGVSVVGQRNAFRRMLSEETVWKVKAKLRRLFIFLRRIPPIHMPKQQQPLQREIPDAPFVPTICI